MRKLSAFALAAFSLCAVAAPAPGVHVALELPPGPDNPRNSEGAFMPLRDGRIMFAYSRYYGESGLDHATADIAARYSSDRGATWTTNDEIVVRNEGGMNVMSVSLLRLRSGEIALFYLRKNSKKDCRPVMRRSFDEGRTWSAPNVCITDEIAYYVLNNDRVIQLKSGRLLFAVALHSLPDGTFDGQGSVVTYSSDDNGKTWQRGKSVLEVRGADGKRCAAQEPGVVELKDGSVLLWMRTNAGCQYMSRSTDGGVSWSAPEPSALVSPLSAATIKRLPAGELLAVWNDHSNCSEEIRKGSPWSNGRRTPLTAAVSRDEGRTWTRVRDIEDDPAGWFCYIALQPLDDGTVLLGYCAYRNLAHSRIVKAPVGFEACFHVAPHGSDLADGTAAAPFASLERARAAAVESSRKGVAATVEIAPGVYELSDTLSFTDGDGLAAPVVFRGAPGGERPLVSAGRRIGGWKVSADGRWRASVPRGWRFSQLYADGARRRRARLPKRGYYFVHKQSYLAAGALPDRFICRPGDVRAEWSCLNEIECLFFHHWNMSRMPIGSFDPKSHEVRLAGSTWNATHSALSEQTWYLLENVREALCEPGEWHLDRADGTLTYIPLPGESPEKTVVTAPRLDCAVRIEGAPLRPVKGIAFENLAFACNAWNVPANGYSFPQAEAAIPGLVSVRNAEKIEVRDCTFRHTATYAVDFGAGAKDCRVERCEMVDLGAGGVKIGGIAQGDVAVGCAAVDNLIAGGGRVHPAAAGVWAGRASRSLISRNTIHDFYYSGVSCGWVWGYGSRSESRNTIEWNDISLIGQRVLSDLGGIYTLGEQPDAVVRCNHVCDATRARYGAWGIYLDQGSAHLNVASNVVHDCEDGGWVMAKVSKDNTIANNVFAFGGVQQLAPNARSPEAGRSFFRNNIVYWDKGPLLQREPPARVEFSSNMYWCASTPGEIDAPPGWLARDPGSRVAKPSFADLDCRLFALASDSELPPGFVPFRLDACGSSLVRGRPMPSVPPAYDPAPPPPKLRLDEDFERLPPGAAWPKWKSYDAAGKSSAAVSDERHCQTPDAPSPSGRSLKVVDSSPGYEPHLCARPSCGEGMVKAAFDLWLDEGAMPSFSMRDCSQSRAVTGPYVGVDRRGRLLGADKRPLLQLPWRAWVHLEISTGLGKDCDGTYSVSVLLPGAASPQTFTGQRNPPSFNRIDWVGFCAHSDNGEACYLDNFAISEAAR